MPQQQSTNPLPMKHLLGLRENRCVTYPGEEGCSCGLTHAETLPANNDPTAIPGDFYENMRGWTVQIQDRVFAPPQGELDGLDSSDG